MKRVNNSQYSIGLVFIDEQKALKCDHMNNIEITDLEKWVSGVYVHFLYYFETFKKFQPGWLILAVRHQSFLKKKI